MRRMLMIAIVGAGLMGVLGCDERRTVTVNAGYWVLPGASDYFVRDEGYCGSCGYETEYSYDFYGD